MDGGEEGGRGSEREGDRICRDLDFAVDRDLFVKNENQSQHHIFPNTSYNNSIISFNEYYHICKLVENRQIRKNIYH